MMLRLMIVECTRKIKMKTWVIIALSWSSCFFSTKISLMSIYVLKYMKQKWNMNSTKTLLCHAKPSLLNKDHCLCLQMNLSSLSAILLSRQKFSNLISKMNVSVHRFYFLLNFRHNKFLWNKKKSDINPHTPNRFIPSHNRCAGNGGSALTHCEFGE